jgi:hypothetical protein
MEEYKIGEPVSKQNILNEVEQLYKALELTPSQNEDDNYISKIEFEIKELSSEKKRIEEQTKTVGSTFSKSTNKYWRNKIKNLDQDLEILNNKLLEAKLYKKDNFRLRHNIMTQIKEFKKILKNEPAKLNEIRYGGKHRKTHKRSHKRHYTKRNRN